jgi:hypothetical protein
MTMASSKWARGAFVGTAVVLVAATGVGVATFVGGLGIGVAEEPGQSLNVPALNVTPAPTGQGTPSPSSSPTTSAGSPAVVDGPAPVTVPLDDHGGDRPGHKDSGGSSSSDH